jgi:hypothetical protein
MLTDRLDHYVPLLAIRRSAARRDTFIIGALLAASLLVGTALNGITEPSSRSTFLETALTIVLALSFAAAWSRYEAIKAVADLAEELRAPKGVASTEQGV